MTRLGRNAAIGAALVSWRALFYRWYDVFVVMLVLGALSGALYTLLEPYVRGRPKLRYLPWILSMYLVLGGGTVVGVLKHDDMSIAILSSPFGIAFLVVLGAFGGYAIARQFEG